MAAVDLPEWIGRAVVAGRVDGLTAARSAARNAARLLAIRVLADDAIAEAAAVVGPAGLPASLDALDAIRQWAAGALDDLAGPAR